MTDAVKMAIERIKARFHPHYGIDGASDSKQLASDCQTLIAAIQGNEEPIHAIISIGSSLTSGCPEPAGIPYRKDCRCDCHNPGSTKLHIMPCCRNDEPAADAGVTQGDADKKLLAHIVSWVHCPAIMSVDQVEQMIAAHRLQSVAAATAAKDARDPLRDIVLRYIDRMNDVAPECGDPADRILGEFASEVNDVLKAERAALSEAGEAGAKD
ncbi:hypothetical protein [Sphingobium yanoikuyae]|uniref:hypothetical protein n=1 Tax=Sphingobium yanoikuyae TaxID=13690 RepID=UPI000846E8DA|nr:hypothetical protein [Sphingobium yanoikuyae]